MTDRLKFGLGLAIVLALVVDVGGVAGIGYWLGDSPTLVFTGGSIAQLRTPDEATRSRLMANLDLRLKPASPFVHTLAVGADTVTVLAPGMTPEQLRRQLKPGRIDLVRWVADSSIHGSNYTAEGFRPQLTGMSSDQFASVLTYHDPKYGWTTELDFRPEATDQLTQLSSELARACPASQDCQLSHLALFANLTSVELENWNTFGMYAGIGAENGGQLVDDGQVSEPFNTAAISWSGFDSQAAADAYSAELNVGAVPNGVDTLSVTAVPPLGNRLPARLPLAALIASLVGALCWGLAALFFRRGAPLPSA